jgi:FkbM family methyltransferase
MSKIDWRIYNSDKISITMPHFLSLIHTFIDVSKVKTIVDAGSLNGADVEFLTNSLPNTIGYAIEGLVDNYNLYIKDNKAFTGINRVIASYDGESIFHEKNINGIHGIYNRGEEYGNKCHMLKCSKLSTIMDEFSIKTIDVIKIDLEGATYDALQSLGDHLQNIQIMHIETETYPFFEGQVLHDTVCQFLEDNQFYLVDISFCEIIQNGFQSDSVWVNKRFLKTQHVLNS